MNQIKELYYNGQKWNIYHNKNKFLNEFIDDTLDVVRSGPRNQNDCEFVNKEFYNIRQCLNYIKKWTPARMTLGEIISKLESIESNKKIGYTENGCPYGVDIRWSSHRGNYYNLALDYTVWDNTYTKDEVLRCLKDAIRVGTMYGYKGGEFDITEDIDVAIADYGDCGPYITDVIEHDNYIEFIIEN